MLNLQRNYLRILGFFLLMSRINACVGKYISFDTSSRTTLNITSNKIDTNLINNLINIKEVIIAERKDKNEARHFNNASDIKNEINDSTTAMLTMTIKDRIKYSELMQSYMNQTVKPCDDFYEYACGNWKNTIEPYDSEHRRNNLLDITYQLLDVVDDFLQNANIETLAPEYAKEFRIVQQFYNNCLTAQLYPMQKSMAYLNILEKIGGFPAVEGDKWNSENFNWINMSAHMSNYDVVGLINEAITSQYPFEPYFKLPDLGFDIELHFDNIIRDTSNAYRINAKRMRDLLLLYGVENEEVIQQIIDDIFEFIMAILGVFKEFQEDLHECERLSDVYINKEEEGWFFNYWRHYYEIAWLKELPKDPMDNTDDAILKLFAMPCLYLYVQMNNICLKYEKAAANYLSLKFLHAMDARLNNIKYQKTYCARVMKGAFSFLLDQLYMKTHFNEDIQHDVADIVKEVRQSLQMILKDAHWLDEATRQAALNKEATMTVHIGRFENPQLMERLIREIQNVTFVNDNYYLNHLKLRKFRKYMKRYNGLHIEELGNHTKPLDLLLGMQVNAYYYNIDNSVYILAGFLHPPTYKKTWPDALKFGTLGYLLGHEFTHGFDTTGANFDGNGMINYWWSENSDKVFNERSNCYVKHYEKYLIPEINRYINGNLTKDENIADSGGLHLALMTYQRFIKTSNNIEDDSSTSYKLEKMPDLDLTPEQLFFLGFTQLWCSSYKEANYWEELLNEHTIDKYRALGALTNNADFAKAFNCSLGSIMHPTETKCKVW